MWAKHKQSEIQMVKRNSTSASSNNCLYCWGENLPSWNKKKYYKLPPDCNPNDPENSHKLKIQTASQKIRRWIYVSNKTDNEFILISTMWAKHKHSEIKMAMRNSTLASSNNCHYWLGEKSHSWNRNFIIKCCQTAIQMIKRIRINSKFEQIPPKIGRWTSVLKWNWQ